MARTTRIYKEREAETENLDSIRFSVEELRQLGNFDNRSDEQLEVISEFLAKCSIIIFEALQHEKRRKA